MGYPNVPDINAEITLTRQDAINIMLASIGLEELSLAHLVNGEAEKLQRALGTLQVPGTEGDSPEDYFPELVGDSIDNLLAVNRNINQTLKIAAHKEFLLLLKLEDLLNFELDEDDNGNGPEPIDECVCSITGQRGQSQGDTIVSLITIDGVTEDVNTQYNIQICEEACNPQVNSLTFSFGLLPPLNFTMGRVTDVLACDPEEGTATLTGTIRNQNEEFLFTLEISNDGEVMDLTIIAQSEDAPFQLVTANITDPENGPLVEIEDCNNDVNGEV